MVKVASVNYSDLNGGAARAAYRIHSALNKCGVESIMYVNDSISGDWTVKGPLGTLKKAASKLRPHLGRIFSGLLNTENVSLHSPAIIPTRFSERFNKSDFDIVHLHWINCEMVSVSDLGRISKPLVWTLHDMWAFCGSEHYTSDFRWRDGYLKNNRPLYETGFDINRWVWNRKIRYWQDKINIVTPSKWLGDCVGYSKLMGEMPRVVIPNALDTNIWKPIDRSLARAILNLPSDAPLLLFGAIGGASDPRKGFDLLKQALAHLSGEVANMELVIFGQLSPKDPLNLGFPAHYFGHLYDDISLSLLYSAADAIVVPSRQEAFGQTASEAHACGIPVVAFDIGGLPDIVQHKITGYLAQALDPVDLAEGIKWVLNNPDTDSMRRAARDYAVNNFSYSVVADKYISLYRSILG